MNKLLPLILILTISIISYAGSSPATEPDKQCYPQVEEYKKVKTDNTVAPVAPETKAPLNKKKDGGGVAALVIFGILFFWVGISLMLLAGIFAILALGALVWFLIGLFLVLLGVIFWSIARQKRRENRRERRRERIKRRRRG